MARLSRILTALALAAVVGSSAGCSDDAPGSSTQAGVTPTVASSLAAIAETPAPAAPVTADKVLADGDLVALSAVGGTVLGLVQNCTRAADDTTTCRTAWSVPSAGASGLLPGRLGWTATTGDGAFVLAQAGGARAVVVSPDGNARPTRTVAAPLSPDRLADAVGITGPRGAALVDPRAAVRATLERPAGVDRWQSVVPDGAGGLWAFAIARRATGQMDVWRSADGARWTTSAIELPRKETALPAYLAATGTHAAALAGYDGATLLPVAALAVTADTGTTWTTLGADDVPFRFVDSLDAAPDGSLYVLGESGEGGEAPRVYRTTDAGWSSFEQVPLPHGVRPADLVATDRGILVRADGDRYLVLGADGVIGHVHRFRR